MTLTRRFHILGAASIAGLLAVIVLPAPAGAQLPEERILYTDRAPRRSEVNSMRPDGTGLRREIRDGDVAALSPDGTRIAFARVAGKGKNKNREIFVQTVGARKATQLTNDTGDDFSPDWSPDGEEIVWARDNVLWVMNADGSNQHVLTKTGDVAVEGSTPAWSHDGSRIAYSSFRGPGTGNNNIFALEVATGVETQLTGDPTENDGDGNPQWSPDDGEIVFDRNPNEVDSNDEIWIVDSAGLVETLVFKDPVGGRDTSDPVFSTNGMQIAFECDLNRDFNRDICTMDADGSDAVTLTTSGHNFAPDWGMISA